MWLWWGGVPVAWDFVLAWQAFMKPGLGAQEGAGVGPRPQYGQEEQGAGEGDRSHSCGFLSSSRDE